MSYNEYLKLIKEISYYDRQYYVLHAPVITDEAYDQFFQKLVEVEKAHPEWVTPLSPTQRVSETTSKGFTQVRHEVPMLSLTNTYKEQEVEDFTKRVQKAVRAENFFAELKMDGIAVSVTYKKGALFSASTRGDGLFGDDIMANIATIASLPLTLIKAPDLLELRGEVFLTHESFEKLNKERELAGEELFANPRNAAAGSLKLLDSRLVAKRNLSILFYGISQISDKQIRYQHEIPNYLAGLSLPSMKDYALCQGTKELMAFAEKVHQKRKQLPFDIDGIVIKVDELSLHEELGMTGKSPRYAIAYKFKAAEAETRVKAITLQVGRTGVITPVAELEKVLLAGSTIARATLHNEEEIARKDIRIGDAVIIQKGGDVIPKIVEVMKEKRPPGVKPWKMETRCPSCQSALVKDEEGVAVRCPNSAGCPAQVLERLSFFASKSAMDIDNLGVKVMQQLFERGFVKSFSDIYALTEKELSELPGFKEKSIHNLLSAIDKSRDVSLDRFILALGIRHVGAETAEEIAATCGSMERLLEMGYDDFIAIPGIGETVAGSLVEFFQDPVHRGEIEALLERGVRPKQKAQPRQDHLFSGKTFVITGTLEHYSRMEAAALITERGGKISDNVSKKTDYLLLGKDPGSKLEKAQRLNIQILNESDFQKVL